MSAGPFDQSTPPTPPPPAPLGTQQPAPPPADASTKDVAKDEAASVAEDAKASTQHVAETAKAEAQQVAHEAQQQIKDLYHQVMSELTNQGSDQKSRASGGLRTLADDLGGMAQHSDSGIGGDLARQAADRTRTVADWLESREPGDIVDEVKRYARRKPGTFLAGAALLGLAAGRLTRGVVAEKQAESSDAPSTRPSAGTHDPFAASGPHAMSTDAAGQPVATPPVGMSTAPMPAPEPLSDVPPTPQGPARPGQEPGVGR